MVPTFSEYLRAKVGSNWVLARRTKRIVERYGADVVCLSRTRYKHLEAQYERETGRSAADPTMPSHAIVMAAPRMLDALREIAADGSCSCHTEIALRAIAEAEGRPTKA